MATVYAIGAKTYLNGREITIITEPYSKYGTLWQDGVIATGKVLTIVTPGQRELDIIKVQEERAEQQAGFKRLRKIKLDLEVGRNG